MLNKNVNSNEIVSLLNFTTERIKNKSYSLHLKEKHIESLSEIIQDYSQILFHIAHSKDQIPKNIRMELRPHLQYSWQILKALKQALSNFDSVAVEYLVQDDLLENLEALSLCFTSKNL